MISAPRVEKISDGHVMIFSGEFKGDLQFWPATKKFFCTLTTTTGGMINALNGDAKSFQDALEKTLGWMYDQIMKHMGQPQATSSPPPRQSPSATNGRHAPGDDDDGYPAVPGEHRHKPGTRKGAIESLPRDSALVDKIGNATAGGYIELWAHAEGGYYLITNGEPGAQPPFYWDWKRHGLDAPKVFRERANR